MANLKAQADMAQVIRWILELLLPSSGRHAQTARERPTTPARTVPVFTPLNAEEIPVVRPYVLAADERTERERQRQRRTLLILATLDMGEVA